MRKARDVWRPLLFTFGVFVLQAPLFGALSKLMEVKRNENNSLFDATAAGQARLLSSFSSQSTDSPVATGGSASAPEETRSKSADAGFKPLGFASYPFVLFSVYRQTLNSFNVIGITSVVVRRYENEQPVYRCEWVPGSKSRITSDEAKQTSHEDHQRQEALVTEPQMLYVRFDENGMLYVPAIVNCTFNQSVGADGKGGLLRLHLSRGPSFWGPNYVVEDVFREKPGELSERRNSLLQQDYSPESSVDPADLPYKYAFCGPPLYGTAHEKGWMEEWLAYHHHLWEGKAHFYFYAVEALNTEARQMLEKWIKAGVLTIIEAMGGEAYPSWYRNQLLFINDCLSRTRFTAQWTFFHDLDELLYVPAPNTLAGLLEEYHDKPWMTFGNLPFSTGHCTAPQTTTIKQQEPSNDDQTLRQPQFGRDSWQLERLLWRNKHPECMHEDDDPWTCVGAPGRRKFIVNPRKVFLAGVHRVAVPEKGGVNFNASVARVHHFHGITNPEMKACDTLVNISDYSEHPDAFAYEFDDALASLMPLVRHFAGQSLLAS